MLDLAKILILLIPLWILVGYLIARGQIKTRTKQSVFILLLCSFIIYPLVYAGSYYLYDSFYMWQDYHCQSSYGLGVPDDWCINPYSLDSSRISSDTFFFVRLLIAFASQVLFLNYIDKRMRGGNSKGI